MRTAQHPAIVAFLTHLRDGGRMRSAATYSGYFVPFEAWCAGRGLDLLHATHDDLVAYQCAVAVSCHVRTGEPLSGCTRVTRNVAVCVLYRWLYRRGVLLFNPAAKLRLPTIPRRLTVAKDHLSQQEVMALLQTLTARVEEQVNGTIPWARELRNLALMATAIATGRRCEGLVTLRVTDLDLERHELRVAREKSRTGRVLPVAAWCIDVLRRYLQEARAIVLGPHRTSDFLFPTRKAAGICGRSLTEILHVAIQETIRRNPDLIHLPRKRISTHSLRVSFASMLFANGCNIRSINELMLHANLSTTSLYVPLGVAELRRALLMAHPRA